MSISKQLIMKTYLFFCRQFILHACLFMLPLIKAGYFFSNYYPLKTLSSFSNSLFIPSIMSGFEMQVLCW